MPSFISDPGPYRFTIVGKNGVKYTGVCYAIQIEQTFSMHEKMETTVKFHGNSIMQVESPKRKKKKTKKKPSRKRK